MQLSPKARKAVASGLAISTLLWGSALTLAPKIASATHTNGCLVLSGGIVWKIENGTRRGFTSAEVFMSHGYNFTQVVAADSGDLGLSVGPIMTYAHGTLVKGPNDPLVYLVVNGQKRGFVSGSVFLNLGYSFSNIQQAPVNTFSDLPTGANIDGSTSAGSLPSSGPGPQTVACSTTTTPPVGSGDCNLSGNAGDITVTQDSTFSAEEVGEGEEEVGILGFEVEADDDSDIAVTSVRVAFYQSDTDVSQDLEDYVDEVQIMMGDDVLATVQPDDFNEDSDIFTKSVSLDCAEVMAGETGEFSVAVSGANTFDSADILDDNWAVDLYSVRFEDADGVTSTLTIDDSDITTADAGAIDETMEFVDFATAADVELSTSLTDDAEDINEAHNVVVEDDNDTDDVEILAFTLEAEGDSDILVKDITVTITGVEAGADDLDTIISSADLYHGSTLVDSQNISDTVPDGIVPVVFEDVDVNADQGDPEDFTVKVNVLELVGNYSQGTTLQATVNTLLIDADDEQGDQLAGAGELSGSAIGEAVSLFSAGITVEVDSADTNVIANDTGFDSVEFVWDLTITNIGEDDVYINSDNAQVTVADGADPAVNNRYAVDDGAGTLTSFSGTITDDGATEVTSAAGEYTGQSFYRLSSGEVETFTITVTATNSVAAAQMQAWLTEIEWTVDDVTSFVGTETVAGFTANLVEDSETPFRLVNYLNCC